MVFILEIRDFVGLRFILEINEFFFDLFEEYCQIIFFGDIFIIYSDNCFKVYNFELYLNFLIGSFLSLKVSLLFNSYFVFIEHFYF